MTDFLVGYIGHVKEGNGSTVLALLIYLNKEGFTKLLPVSDFFSHTITTIPFKDYFNDKYLCL